MSSAPLPLHPAPIRFGTDGWRGVIGVDITVERLLTVAAAAAEAPSSTEGSAADGGDRLRPALPGPELAEAIAAAVRGCELEPLLTDTPSLHRPAAGPWWAKDLGALVITASHNPPEWLGLKIKVPSVDRSRNSRPQSNDDWLPAASRHRSRRSLSFDGRGEHLEGSAASWTSPPLCAASRPST